VVTQGGRPTATTAHVLRQRRDTAVAAAVATAYRLRDVADDDSLTPRQWLALLAKSHRLLVGSVAAHVLLLIALPQLWSIQIEGHSRSGRAFFMSAAARDLWIAGIGAAMYAIAGIGVPHHWAMSPPTDGEISVARWLMRAIGLLTLWASLVITFRALP
jgi:hypothetical protein